LEKQVVCLRGLLDHDAYLRYGPALHGLKDTEREIKQILTAIQQYYKRYPEQKAISVDELRVFFHQQHPALKDKDVFDVLFDQIQHLDISNPDLLEDALRDVVEQYYVGKLCAVGLPCLNGESTGVIEKMKEILEEGLEKMSKTGDQDDNRCNMDLDYLLDETFKNGLYTPLRDLRSLLGPIYPGTLGHIFARPETGKTSFASAMASAFAYQVRDTSDIILYLNNEEDKRRIALRIWVSMIGQPIQFLDGNREEARRIWSERGGDRIEVIGGVTHISQVEQYISEFRPRAVFVDQGPNVSIPGDMSGTDKLTKLYKTYRKLAGKYETIFISIGQADSQAENKQWLTMNNIDSSKVGIPGACDYIIGVGMKDDPGMEEMRYINLPKNKLTGQKGRLVCRLDVNTSRYVSV